QPVVGRLVLLLVAVGSARASWQKRPRGHNGDERGARLVHTHVSFERVTASPKRLSSPAFLVEAEQVAGRIQERCESFSAWAERCEWCDRLASGSDHAPQRRVDVI